jgi:hypothetical protein
MAEPTLKIGLGTYQYSFPPGIVMGGYAARHVPSQGTHDPITARAVLLDNGTTRLLLVEADFVGLDQQRVLSLKEKIHTQFGIAPEQILIGIIHTHSAPLNIRLFTEPSPGIQEQFDTGVFLAVERAIQNFFPGTIEIAQGEIPAVSFNRRDWDPLSNIIDNGVTLLKFYDTIHNLRGLLYNYSCHPVVMGPENLYLTADWPFFAQEYLRNSLHAPELFVMFMQGTPGNLNPRNTPMGGPPVLHSFTDCQEIGDDVGKALVAIQKTSVPLAISKLEGVIKSVEIPLDDEDKMELFENFAQVEEKEGQFLMHTLVQGIQIGDLVIIGFPGEIFPEIALHLKTARIFPHLMVVGYANDYIGYVGTAAVYNAGGYEMMMMAASEREGELLENTARSVLNELKSPK